MEERRDMPPRTSLQTRLEYEEYLRERADGPYQENTPPQPLPRPETSTQTRLEIENFRAGADGHRGEWMGPRGTELDSMIQQVRNRPHEDSVHAVVELTWKESKVCMPWKTTTAKRVVLPLAQPLNAPVDWRLPLLRTDPAITESTVHRCEVPFAEGALRSAFYLEDVVFGRMVAKRARVTAVGAEEAARRAHFADAETQAVCRRLALEFNLRGVPQAVDFLPTSLYCVHEDGEGKGEGEEVWYAAEPWLAGRYQKYTNNERYVAKPVAAAAGGGGTRGGLEDATMSSVAQAFSHFSWCHTGGHLMAVDLQGVGNVFTDPQIHCSSRSDRDRRRFGRGNLGTHGMHSFFQAHVCNGVCEMLQLPRPDEGCRGNGAAAQPVAAGAGQPRGAAAAAAAAVVAGAAAAAGAAGPPPPPSTLLTAVDLDVCCSLCGDGVTISLRALRCLTASGVEVHCSRCQRSMALSVDRRRCSRCGRQFRFCEYWFYAKGFRLPDCADCEAGSGHRRPLHCPTDGNDSWCVADDSGAAGGLF